ncbi:MAG: glycosyltransferase family 4 protein [Candidatus Yanofskybacteria bacterium]|nr:glycosyltransferase family 4 protein [Candidatus Yanofskybacteria bacterium]
MKKILITTGIFYPDIGGPASYAMTLGRNSTGDRKITIVTYSSKFNYPSDKELPFRVVRVWRKWPKGLRHLIYFFRVFSEAKKNDVILSLNAVSAGVPALRAARMRKKKIYVKIVGDYAWEIAVNKKKSSLLINDFQDAAKKGFIKTLSKLQRQVCLKADGVIVPSQYLAGIVKKWGVPPDRVRVIYNGVDFKESELSKEEARKKIGIPGNIIVSIGRLVPWKGFKMLVKIMPELLKISQFFRLVIIGDGPEKKQLEAMVKNMGLEKKVYIVGKKNRDEIAVYLAAADMFVLNSGYEGFSHQILEAMAAGVPIIASAVGGNKEVIEQGRNGFLVKYNDEFNLIEAIRGMHQSLELRDEFAAAGRETVAKYGLERMISQTFKLLEG